MKQTSGIRRLSSVCNYAVRECMEIKAFSVNEGLAQGEGDTLKFLSFRETPG